MGLFDSVSVDNKLDSVFKEPVESVAPVPKSSAPKNEATSSSSEASEASEASDDSEASDLEHVGSDDEVDTDETKPTTTTKPSEAATKIDESSQTIFVKNVPNQVVTDRKVYKQFKQLFQPGVKSIRFRSIAMSEMLPRKVAYIKKMLHPARDAVNSYVVFENQSRAEEVLESSAPLVFKDHHMFIDSVSQSRFNDSKSSVFIGNLPFEATEEQLYRHFEDCGQIDNVRIIRDRKFNLGKGFAYIQFNDVSQVQVALMKNESKFEGRSLRVTKSNIKQRHTASKSFKQKTTPRLERRKEQRAAQAKQKDAHKGANDKPAGKPENRPASKPAGKPAGKPGKPTNPAFKDDRRDSRNSKPSGKTARKPRTSGSRNSEEQKPEGLRAKEGDKVHLGRKRKPRSPFGRNAKRQKS